MFFIFFYSSTWPIIGADGKANGYGNGGVGEVTGPGQTNFDSSIQKAVPIRENRQFLIRREFFDAFNHPQFANPGVSTNAAATFGVITRTSVNSRNIQLAVKFTF